MLTIFQTQRTVEACRINMIPCLAEMECIVPITEMPLLATAYTPLSRNRFSKSMLSLLCFHGEEYLLQNCQA